MSWNSIYKNKETTTCSVSPIWKEIFLDFPCPSDGGLHGLHHRPGRHLQKSAKRLRENGNTMCFFWLIFFSFFKFRYAVKSKLSTTLSRAKSPNCIRLLVRDSLVLKGWWFTGDPSWFPSACVGGCCIYTTRGQRRGSQTPAWFEPRYGGSQPNVLTMILMFGSFLNMFFNQMWKSHSQKRIRKRLTTLSILLLRTVPTFISPTSSPHFKFLSFGMLWAPCKTGEDPVGSHRILPFIHPADWCFELDPTAACTVGLTGETWKVRQPNMTWGSPVAQATR